LPPCPCAADGVMLAVYASPGQGTLQIAPEKSPADTFAVVVVGLATAVLASNTPCRRHLWQSSIQDPLGRYTAVMVLPDIFSVEPAK
jgi:hypothetical protein